MSWIQEVSYEQASGKLKKLYDRVKGPDNNVDNIMLAHSLRPHTMEGHMTLYKNTLHHFGNQIDKWFLEALGVYTSLLNECHYCVDHHFAGMARLLGDQARADLMKQSLIQETYLDAFSAKQAAALTYSKLLTRTASSLTASHIETLRQQGWDDGEILEINQVVAYFNYANRTVLGLGVNTDGDILGLSPNASDDPDAWNHS